MIEGIEISGFKEMEFHNRFNEKIDILENLKKVNIFIGENNCGKSRLMRSFLKENLTIYSTENLNTVEKNNKYFSYIEDLKYRIEQLRIHGKDIINNEMLLLLPNDNDDKEIFYNINKLLPQLIKIKSQLSVSIPKELKVIQQISNIISVVSYIKNMIVYSNIGINQRNIIYIPVLRGIENFEMYFKSPKGFDQIKMTPSEFESFEEFKDNAKHVYKNKVASAYNIPSGKIFTAESLYDDIINKLLGDEENRKFIRDFENFIKNNFYDGIEFSITPNKNKKYLGIKIGKNSDRALYDLGEGIKQLIVLFYKVFEQKDNGAIFLIEEPELNLHPGFQRKFIDIITKCFPEHQFFITTHSNHIIDLYDEKNEISLYKFKNSDKQNSKFYVERVLPRDISVLEEIGARNSSMFMSNCTIWVEGISDKIYISKYLELYFNKNCINSYKEDIHYSFIEYGGNNITHWSFIDDNCVDTINASAITHHIFMVCDNDNNSKKTRKEKLQKVLGERLYILKSREIENLISKIVLEKTLKKDNKLEELSYKRYQKNGYTEDNYARPNIKMATFIDKTFELRKQYAGESDALKNKIDFARKAIENMTDYDDLTEEAKELTQKIYNFIKESNKR